MNQGKDEESNFNNSYNILDKIGESIKTKNNNNIIIDLYY